MTTQTTLMAVGTASATSTAILLGKDDVLKVGIFSATEGDQLLSASFAVFEKTPGARNAIARLDGNAKSTLIYGPGSFEIDRPALTGPGYGIYTEV